MVLPGRGVRRRHNSLEEEEGGIDGLPQPPSHSSDTWAWRRHAARALLLLAGGVAITVTTLYHDGVSTADTAGAITTPRSPSETAGAGPFWGRLRRRDMKGVVPQPPPPLPPPPQQQRHVQYQAQALHAPDDPKRRRGDRRLDDNGYGLPGYEELTDPSWWVGWLPYNPFSTTAAPTPTASPTNSPTHHPTPAPTTRAELMLDYAAYVHKHGVTKRGHEYPGGWVMERWRG